MNIREQREQIENTMLSPYGVKSIDSKGRKYKAEKCDIRTEFQRDRDKITHCKSFRRLMHKTQVFIAPEGDHYRTRLTHTLEVSQISRTISRALMLNEDLTEAIALGHDLGHTPFGHMGEEVLDGISKETLKKPFHHNEQSIRIVELIEKNGKGLNLTAEVLDGILHHRTQGKPSTLEGKVVQLSDKIAYINHDIDDAIRAGLLKQSELPNESLESLGKTSAQRINFLIRDVIQSSFDKNEITLSEHVRRDMNGLRDFMFDTVYLCQLQLNERKKIQHMLQELFHYYCIHPETMPKEFYSMIEKGEQTEMVVRDFIACMTDRYAIKMFTNLYLPVTWSIY